MAALRQRLATREGAWLGLIREAVYGHRRSPYRRLLRQAAFLDVDVIRILEEILPARFGGAPGDYQLVEDETADARPGLALVVHPAVGTVDEAALVDTFLRNLGRGGDATRVMALAWKGSGLLRVERRAPWTTGTGKVLHLYRPSVKARLGPTA